MDKHLHIVTHDVPWPADFGGMFDLFYKIKSLHQQGIKIHLHCFTNKRAEQPILNRYCESVNYYPRRKKLSVLPYSIPYIVLSRCDDALIENLQKDNYPVILEGIHCTYHLFKGKLQNRKVVVRLHNVEYNYYRHLARHENNFFKKTYFFIESLLLKKYERKLAQKATFWAVSKSDEEFYHNKFNAKQINFLPVFIPWNKIKCDTGIGNFCLYHGNLSINENEKAAIWLLEEVFRNINIPFVIAGKDPSASLKKLAHSFPHTCIVENPTEHELDDLIRKAQINVLPSFNKTGVKLKLLNALFNGRHCVVNKEAAEGTGVESFCHFANDANEFKSAIEKLNQSPFTEIEKDSRSALLNGLYSNEKNAAQIIAWLY